MNQVLTTAENIFSWLQPVTWVVIAAALLGTGIAMSVGGDEGRQKAKKALPWVAVGGVIIILAVNIAKEFVTKVAL